MTDQHEPEMDRFTDNFHRALFKASGERHESSRFVQFLFMLLRDQIPSGKLGEALLRTFDKNSSMTPERAARFLRENPAMFVDPKRLIDEPNERHTLFIAHLCTVCRSERDPYRIPEPIELALKNTPGDDEIVAFVSNGWILDYCRFVAASLRDGLPA